MTPMQNMIIPNTMVAMASGDQGFWGSSEGLEAVASEIIGGGAGLEMLVKGRGKGKGAIII